MVVASVVVLALLLLVAVAVRRRSLTGAPGSFDCSVRADGRWWAPGVARFGTHSVQWWRAVSLDPRPRAEWARTDLDVVGRGTPARADAPSLVPHAVVVHCTHRGGVLDLAMSADAATGLTSWLEAAPPGPSSPVT